MEVDEEEGDRANGGPEGLDNGPAMLDTGVDGETLEDARMVRFRDRLASEMWADFDE